MKNYLSITIAGILTLSAPSIAKAQIYVTANIGGVPSVSGATLENCDEPTPPSILTLSGNAYLVTGINYGVEYVPPYFSGSTAALFGESPQNGIDNSQYVAVWDGGSATFSFSTPQNYFGLLWGTAGHGDCLTFYDGANNVIGTVLGANLPTNTGLLIDGPDWGLNETGYVNIISTTAFSRVVATNPVQNSFEFDDVAYAVVPEPASLSLLAIGMFGITLLRRRQH
ncbi:MAG: PEP-CTERM sorting domain-containing protein [Verrucomicrobiota bacterium]